MTSTEDLLTMEEAALLFPGTGTRTHASPETVRKWTTTGIRGIKLGIVKVGASRFTTRTLIERFRRDLEAAGVAGKALGVRIEKQTTKRGRRRGGGA